MPISLPLTGLRVLTFENFGAGPFGSMYLADLGAEVIKIENRDQGGDATRSMGPFFLGEHDSQFFQAFNLNKKSVTLNLKHAAGREAFHKLVRTADVVLNNLRGDQPEKLGLDYGRWVRSIHASCARTSRPTAATTNASHGRDTTT